MYEIIFEISYSGMADLNKDKKCKNTDSEQIDKLEFTARQYLVFTKEFLDK